MSRERERWQRGRVSGSIFPVDVSPPPSVALQAIIILADERVVTVKWRVRGEGRVQRESSSEATAQTDEANSIDRTEAKRSHQ